MARQSRVDSLLHILLYSFLPFAFFTTFIIAGTMILSYTFYLSKPVPRKFAAGIAVVLSVPIIAGLIIAFVIWERRKKPPILGPIVSRPRFSDPSIMFRDNSTSTRPLTRAAEEETVGGPPILPPLPAHLADISLTGLYEVMPIEARRSPSGPGSYHPMAEGNRRVSPSQGAVHLVSSATKLPQSFINTRTHQAEKSSPVFLNQPPKNAQRSNRVAKTSQRFKLMWQRSHIKNLKSETPMQENSAPAASTPENPASKKLEKLERSEKLGLRPPIPEYATQGKRTKLGGRNNDRVLDLEHGSGVGPAECGILENYKNGRSIGSQLDGEVLAIQQTMDLASRLPEAEQSYAATIAQTGVNKGKEKYEHQI